MPEQHKKDPRAAENDPGASDLPGEDSREGAKKRHDPQ